MTPRPRNIVVLRRHIESDPRPTGGDFASQRWLPRGTPTVVSRALGVFCADTTDPVVALTYDDGPHPTHTPLVLDALSRHQARATFFVLARQARTYPDLTRRIVAEGHEIALHGDDHKSLLDMSTREAVAMVRRAKREVEEIAGARIDLYRPPYGAHTPRQAMAIRRLGLDIVIWSADGMDWLDATPQTIADRVVGGLFSGGIVLLHDDRGDPETLQPHEEPPRFNRGEVANLVLTGIAGRGMSATTASALLQGRTAVRSLAKGRAAKGWSE